MRQRVCEHARRKAPTSTGLEKVVDSVMGASRKAAAAENWVWPLPR